MSDTNKSNKDTVITAPPSKGDGQIAAPLSKDDELRQQINSMFPIDGNDLDILMYLIKQYGIQERKAMGARLNQKLFFSTTQPDGQFVKDCIIEELNQAEDERLTALKAKGEK